MAKTIKTREVARDVKVRTPNLHIGRQMKVAALKAKDAAAKQVQEPQADSPNEYTENAIEEKAKSAAHEAVQTADSRGRTAVKNLRERQRPIIKEKGSPKASPANLPDTEIHVEIAAPDKIQLPKRKTQQKKKKTSRQRGKGKTGKSAINFSSEKANQTKRKVKNSKPKQKPRRTVGRTQKSAKTVEKSAKTTKQTAQRTKQAIEQSVKATKMAVKTTWKLIKTAAEGTKLLIEAIIAGGWVAIVIILVICLAGFLIASPFGIFFSGDGEQSLPQVVQTLTNEYYDRFELLKTNYVHDFLNIQGGTMALNWTEMLAVYAVKVVNDPFDPAEVTTFDEKKVEKLRKILNEMNSFTYSVQNLEIGDNIQRTLTIHLSLKSAAQMAESHHFSSEQKAQLNELLSEDYADLWAQLLGGYSPNSGEILQGDDTWKSTNIFAWPLQMGYRISSKFGWRDDPLNPGMRSYHNGIDLACEAGTKILAAADGIVEVANSTDNHGGGFGYYVKVKHSNGLATLYAHCSKIAVRVGEEVKQGQVIAFVGSTGNSTGPHLHFEAYQNGTRVDPLGFFGQK